MFAPCRTLPWLCLALSLACTKDKAPDQATPTSSASASAAATAVPPSHSAGSTQGPIDGAALYQRYCALCHAKDGTGYIADNAPSLVSQTFLESASNHFIAQGIRAGRPGTAMAGYEKRRGGPLEPKEVTAIVKFLRSKGPAPKRLPQVVAKGDPERGERVWAEQCATCHGTEGQRGKAPMLHNPEFLATATPAFLHYAIVQGRPPTQMPAFAGKLSDTQIDDVVMYLHSKKPGYRPPLGEVDMDALKQLPVVMNPKGGTPNFTARENRFVSVDQVKKAWDAKNRMVIIDARAASDFVRSHIPGSISNPYYDKAGLDRVPNDGTWVIAYCACPHHASGEVVDELGRRGFKNAAILDEGVLEWEKRGYPVAPLAPTGEKK
jgi:mono/diheme cytochrome c family protein/rhodanese-related sulfurtransferase